MQMTDMPRSAGQQCAPAPILKDPALGASLQARVLTLDLCARLALVNGALRALRGLGIVTAAQDLYPLDGGPPRIDLGVIARLQADLVLAAADASTRDTNRQLYTASAYGVRLVWGIPR